MVPPGARCGTNERRIVEAGEEAGDGGFIGEARVGKEAKAAMGFGGVECSRRAGVGEATLGFEYAVELGVPVTKHGSWEWCEREEESSAATKDRVDYGDGLL